LQAGLGPRKVSTGYCEAGLQLYAAAQGVAMKRRTAWNVSRTACAAVCLAGSFAFVDPLQAAEYGQGTYLLGLSIPMMGFTPPPGFYLSDSVYAYQGSASGNKKFPFGHANLAAQIKEDFLVNVSTLTWVTDTKILEGNLGFAATVPFPIGRYCCKKISGT